jgi:hypothetical protein
VSLRPPLRAWVLGAAFAIALGGAWACRGAREGAPRAPAAAGRLVSRAAVHDFGRVLDGDPLRHVFPVTNAGTAPVRIARIDRSPACSPGTPPAAPLGPGETATIAVECDSRNRPPKLADTILIHPDDGGAPLPLELRATIDPLVAFDTTLVTLETMPGRPISRVVRLVGPLASRARLEVKDVGSAAGVRAHVLPGADGRGPGLELALSSGQAGERADRVLVATGLDRPGALTLPYLARVKSGIEVEPARPYFNLHDPAGRSLMLSVRGSRPGFRVHRAEVVSGPFKAAVEGTGVRVEVDEVRLPPGERGVLGTLVMVTNDPAETRKEIQLFAMGAVHPPPGDDR